METKPVNSSRLPLTLALLFLASCEATNEPEIRGPQSQPATALGIYAPQQHRLYDGRFNISASNVYQVGSLNDTPPWDHMGNDAGDIKAVAGNISIDVNEIDNTGTFTADLELSEGRYVVTLEHIYEFSPCQDGGIAAFLYEHGDAGCGDSNWPKSLLYIAGWGYGSATLNGETLYQDYEIHFMVTQGMRHRETLQVMLNPDSGNAGSVNPAAQQLDFYIRSPARSALNHPNREVFDHFFAMEVTWR
tara:strand:+ start:6190 stop:6930 length:741 start_codon:yes stop_codon:yes gene_type:complete